LVLQASWFGLGPLGKDDFPDGVSWKLPLDTAAKLCDAAVLFYSLDYDDLQRFSTWATRRDTIRDVVLNDL
jgi:hypothetical protein